MKTLMQCVVATAIWGLLCGTTAMANKPVIELTNPIGGYTSNRVIYVEGRIQNAPQLAKLVFNGTERPLQLMPRGDGSAQFRAALLSPPGQNSIIVEAKNKHGKAHASTSFYSKVPPLNLSVVLSWDTNGTDIDLHVTDPSGERCFYGHSQTKAGGKLDVDDTDGYGPEVFTLANALEGEYIVSVKYFSDNGFPQTLASVDVIAFEGTDREARHHFDVMLTRTDNEVEVGRFTIRPSVIKK